jgi:transposase
MRQTELALSEPDREKVQELLSKGVISVRCLKRAQILSCLDRGIQESSILDTLEVGRSTIWRIRKDYLEGGLDKALYDEKRSGRPRQFGDDITSQIVALACSDPPQGMKRWTIRSLTDEAIRQFNLESISRETVRMALKKSSLKPWRKKMWCIGDLTPEYRERMYNLLDLYSLEFDPLYPVICLDEKSKQIISNMPTKLPIRMKEGAPEKIDYEYIRKGTSNFFVAVEPKGGKRTVSVTERRTKIDFVNFVLQLAMNNYSNANHIHIVLDNLNTHFKRAFDDILGVDESNKLFERITFHHTPKHASWLNLAENEIGVLDRQCLSRRFNDLLELQREVDAWLDRRNAAGTVIKWTYTREKADQQLGKHYVS